MNNTADVIIIGGGAQGASLAFHLAGARARSILLEKKFVGTAGDRAFQRAGSDAL